MSVGIPRSEVAGLLAAAVLGGSVVYTLYLPLALLSLIVILGLVAGPPRYAVFLLALSLGLNLTVVSRPVHISVPQFLGIAVVGSFLIRRLLFQTPRQRPGRLWAWSGFLFALSTVPSLMVTVAPLNSLLATTHLLFIAAITYATVELFSSGEISIERSCQFALLGAAISVAPAMLQSIFSIGPPSFVRGGLMRAYSTFGQPNAYGHYLAGMVPLAAGLLLRRSAYGVALALTSVALALTGSRGALVATLVALFALSLIVWRRHPLRAAPLALVPAALVAVALLFLPRGLPASLLSLGDWSVEQRIKALQTTWLGIIEQPVWGYGAGSFKALISDIRVPGLVDDIEMPHNMLLDIWFELGLPALLVFCLLIFLYIRATVSAYRRTGDGLLLALLGAFIGLITTSLFGTLVVRGIGEFLALTVGMTAGRLQQLESRGPGSAPVRRQLARRFAAED